MEEKNSLVTLVSSSGLEEKKQNEIADTLNVFFSKASEWDETIASIVINDPSEVGKMRMAREGRLYLRSMRLDAEKLVKIKRDEVKYLMNNFVLEDKLWLKAGQMIEATFKNLETKLEEKEKFAERWEAQEKEKIKLKRLEELLPLGFQLENGFDLAAMSESMYQSFKSTIELERKKEEEYKKKLEEESIERQKLEKEEREKMLAENEKLKSEKRKQDEIIKKEREETLRLQNEIRLRLAQEEKAKNDAIEKELKDLKLKQKEEARLAKAPIKKQMKIWVDSFSLGKPISENDITIEIEKKFESFKLWAINLIENG
jgi:hypothetical protein